jgi:hypothetical protein
MLLYGESQFDLRLSQLLQLVNAWPVELRDDYVHNLLEKHNEKLLWSQNLWSQQPNRKTSLALGWNCKMNVKMKWTQLLEKHNEKLLWSQQPNRKISLALGWNCKMNVKMKFLLCWGWRKRRWTSSATIISWTVWSLDGLFVGSWQQSFACKTCCMHISPGSVLFYDN